MNKEHIAVGVINYNSSQVLINLLRSINEDNLHIEIFVLDNFSNDDSVKILSSFNEVKFNFIISEKNLGFAGGCNYLSNYIKDTKSHIKFLCFLNPDVVLSSNDIYKLYVSIKKNKNIVAVSPTVYDFSNILNFNYGKIDWKNCKMINVCKTKRINDLISVDFFNGCCVLLKKEIFDCLNGFDDDLFMYYDEAFLSMRIKKIGYKIFQNNKVKIKHRVSYSFDKHSHVKSYYISRNRLMFFSQFSPNNLFIVLLKCVFIDIRNILFFLRNFKIKNIIYIFLGWLHFLISKKGAL